MPPPRPSAVWQHYTRIENIATCVYCDHKITHNQRYGTGNLSRHLKKKHPEISWTENLLVPTIQDEKPPENDSTNLPTIQSDFAVLIPIVKIEEEETEADIEIETFEKTPEPVKQIKPCKCDYCDSTFNNRRQLRIHLRTHTGERPYLCPECGKRYTQIGHLSDHLNKHTGVKVYHCSALRCTKAFYRRSELERHEKIHSGDKPFQCELCPKSFVQKNNLVMHVRAHNNERPHVCSVCQKGFITKSKLRLHAGRHIRKLQKQSAEDELRSVHIVQKPLVITTISSDSEDNIDVAEVGKQSRLFED